MAAQRVQHYLDLHKIGPLFEDLMAALIKDMPNEPIQYLIRVLQKADQKLRSPRGMSSFDKSKSVSSPGLHKYGIGVTGHSAPKRSVEEPHMALPGGKSSGAVWNSTNLSKSHERPSSSDHRRRGYEKPWMSGIKSTSKSSQIEHKKVEKHGTSKKKPEWNPDTKSKAKDVDDLFSSKEASRAKPLSAQNVEKHHLSHYDGARTWSAGLENEPPKDLIIQGGKAAKIANEVNDEIDVKEIATGESGDKMDVDSSIQRVKSKKLKASSQSAEKRIRLKALLSEDKSSSNKTEKDDESGDDDSVEVLEHADDLEGEGVVNPVMSGAKLSKSYRSKGEESKVQIKICARCAKVIATGQNQYGASFSDTDSECQPNLRPEFSDVPESEDDFESVSQVGLRGAGGQKWPTIRDTDANASQAKHMYRSIPRNDDVPLTGRDFFEQNAPMRSKQPSQKPGTYYSDTESDSPAFPVGSRDPTLASGRAWEVKRAETGSEAESDFLT